MCVFCFQILINVNITITSSVFTEYLLLCTRWIYTGRVWRLLAACCYILRTAFCWPRKRGRCGASCSVSVHTLATQGWWVSKQGCCWKGKETLSWERSWMNTKLAYTLNIHTILPTTLPCLFSVEMLVLISIQLEGNCNFLIIVKHIFTIINVSFLHLTYCVVYFTYSYNQHNYFVVPDW